MNLIIIIITLSRVHHNMTEFSYNYYTYFFFKLLLVSHFHTINLICFRSEEGIDNLNFVSHLKTCTKECILLYGSNNLDLFAL